MKTRTLFSITAILSFINGSFFLLLPVLSQSLLGQSITASGVMNTRISGACALGLSVITWLAKDLADPKPQRIVAFGNLVTLGLLAFIDVQGLIIGAINWVGWLFFLTDFLLSIGFVLLIAKKDPI